MTDAEKITLAKRVMATECDRVTEYLLSGLQSLENANMALVLIRESLQDCVGALMEQEKH